MSQHTLSSTAERCYWLGRYLERAECTARMVNVTTELLIDLPVRLPPAWPALVQISGAEDIFAEHFSEASEQNVCRFLISDARNQGSIARSLDAAKENARTLRGIMPRVVFEYVNQLQLETRKTLAEPLSRTRRAAGLAQVMQMVQRIEGFLSANMLHDASWAFLRLGYFIERADMLTRIVDIMSRDLLAGNPELAPFADVQWRSVLRTLHAHQSYTAIVQEPVTQGPVLEFLFQHEQLPRSYTRCIRQVRNSLRSLPRHDKPLREANRMQRHIDGAKFADLNDEALHGALDDLQQQLASLHTSIDRTYFSFQPRRKVAAKPKRRRTT